MNRKSFLQTILGSTVAGLILPGLVKARAKSSAPNIPHTAELTSKNDLGFYKGDIITDDFESGYQYYVQQVKHIDGYIQYDLLLVTPTQKLIVNKNLNKPQNWAKICNVRSESW